MRQVDVIVSQSRKVSVKIGAIEVIDVTYDSWCS